MPVQETVLRRIFRRSFVLLVMTAATVAGCAASGESSPGSDRFDNLLVIGIAGTWDSRAQFERGVVSGLRAEGVGARSYLRIASDPRAPTRDDVLAVIAEYDFDAVLVTRVLDTASSAAERSTTSSPKVTRKDSGFMKLFRYDYEEISDPAGLEVNMEVEFVTELYSAASEEVVWSSQTKAPKSDSVAVLIDESAKLVVRKVRRSGKLAR